MCANHQGGHTEHGSISCSGMVEQVSGGARPKWGHQSLSSGKPQVVTENSLLPQGAVLMSACTCCWHQPSLHCCQHWSHHSHLLSALSVGVSSSCQLQSPLRASEGWLLITPTAAPELPLSPTTGAWSWLLGADSGWEQGCDKRVQGPWQERPGKGVKNGPGLIPMPTAGSWPTVHFNV